MKNIYATLGGKSVSLVRFTMGERRFLGRLSRDSKDNASYLDFENLYMDPSSPIFLQAKRLGRPVCETPLFLICDDLGKRLGIRQGFLVQEEVSEGYSARGSETRELTTGEVAKLAVCTDEAVRKAIRTGRLRARRVGKFSLIRENDAYAFAAARGKIAEGRSP